MGSADTHTTYFLNVDLDVLARSSLEPLAAALGNRVFPLYVGRHAHHFRAHFELHASPRKGANALIVGLARLVKELPPKARAVWNGAYRRDFNIGIQAGSVPDSYELFLTPDALSLASSVNARIVLTIYAATASTSRRPSATR
jgi:hypothetical protein